MNHSTLIRGTAAALFNGWLVASSPAPLHAQDIGLREGQLNIFYADEAGKEPVAEFNGKRIGLGYGSASHTKTFDLPDRQIVIIETLGDVRGMPPRYHVLSVGPKRAFRKISGADFSTSDGRFEATQKGGKIYVDLGFDKGLKKDAVVSSNGAVVFTKKVGRPSIPEYDCKWLQEDVLSECAMSRERCEPLDLSMASWRGLSQLEHNPRWKVAESRFETLCKKACETGKAPPYSEVAKDICGL